MEPFVYMATTHNELCPVVAVLSYLVHHPSGEGSLFQFSDGSSFTIKGKVRVRISQGPLLH